MKDLFTDLALLGLALYSFFPVTATCLETANNPNGRVPLKLPNELNPDEMTQPFFVWQNSPLTRQENPQNASTRICRCLNCAHMTQQKTIIRFSSIGTVIPQTGFCHLPVPVRPGGPIEETTREKYQILNNPGRVTLFWIKLFAKPDDATFLISKLNGRKVYIARYDLGRGLMAFGSLDPQLPESIFTHNVSTRNASFLENFEVLTFRLTREQAFFLETPPLELNPDEVEYRVQLKDGPNLELDLSCKVNNNLKSEPQDETIFLELYRKDPFPFRWEKRDDIFPDERFKSGVSKRPLKLYLDDVSWGLYFLCRSTASNGDILYGMVEPRFWPTERHNLCLPCTIYHGGQHWNVSTYEVLTNPKKVEVAWVEVPSWREVPSSAYITSLSPVETCNLNVGRALNKRYIGRVVTGGVTQAVFNFPDGFKDESGRKVGSPFGRNVKLNESSVRQVLVAAPSSEQLKTGLVCKKTSQLLDLSTFREEPRLMVKMGLEKGGEMVRPRIQKIFQKVEPKQLVWRTQSDLNISYGGPENAFICRYRCRGSNPCPKRQITVNGSTLIQTIDQTIGYSKRKTITVSPAPLDAHHPLHDFFIQFGPPKPPPPKKIETCLVAFGGVAYETEIFEKLSNHCELKLNWRRVSSPFPNGTLAVVNEKGFIARITRPDGSYLIGQVAKSGILTFVDEEGKAKEAIVNEKVSLLTVEA